MSRIRSYGPSVVLLVAMSVTLFGGPFVMRQLAWAEQDARLDQARSQLKDSPLVALGQAFRDVARAVEPSVVHIQVSRKASAGGQNPFGGGEEIDPNELFRRFFRDRGFEEGLPEQEEQPNPRRRPQREADPYEQFNPLRPSGSGSGWIYQHANGEKYIITNNHVVEGADQVLVKFYDKSERIAQVVGTDPQTDVAVLKVDNGSLHPAKLAGEPVEQGDLVFAFGSPFQFEFSMSQGIVSGKGRRLGILGASGYEDFIQTDAAINPGNSGGPLTNVYGEVIGMNSAIATRTGAFNGLGFAIPTPMIKNVVAQIIDEGKVSRGYLGVWIKDLEDKLARSFGFDGKGVLVEDVVDKDSPAAKAGLVGGDIITEVNGKPVTTASELRGTVAMYQPGETVKMKVFREGKFTTASVKLGELPKQEGVQSRIVPGNRRENVEPNKLEPLHKLGFEQMSTLTEDLAAKNNLDVDGGVLVESVRSGSVADLQGIGRGVVILEVNGKAVESLEGLAEQVGSANLAEGVRMRVLVGGVKRFVFLELPEFKN